MLRELELTVANCPRAPMIVATNNRRGVARIVFVAFKVGWFENEISSAPAVNLASHILHKMVPALSFIFRMLP